jgi:metal-sulfur cluster biosynthetic enzyme
MRSAKATEVWEALSTVCDPELDEPITDLEFVEEVVVAGSGDVTVQFRLPTAWCSPNFAWLMATGIVTEVGKLDWVKEVRPILRDHIFGNKINEGLTLGNSFEEVFGNEVSGSIEEVRKKFVIKAFQRRQELVIKDLLNYGLEVFELLAMTLIDLSDFNFNNENENKNRLRYIEARGKFTVENTAAFIDENGEKIHPKNFQSRMEKLRSTRLNMEFTGSVCRSLLKVRDKSETS